MGGVNKNYKIVGPNGEEDFPPCKLGNVERNRKWRHILLHCL